jgi:thioredoxin-like negative regulator of GroEL
MIAPVLDEIAAALEGRVPLMTVNVDESSALAARYEIRSIPTILIVKDGTVVDRVVGAVPRTVLQNVLARHAGSGLRGGAGHGRDPLAARTHATSCVYAMARIGRRGQSVRPASRGPRAPPRPTPKA